MHKKRLLAPRIPLSTYRLQFNSSFRFTDAAGTIAYLSDLGITDIYASPYFKAQKGSTHGYDIVDPNVLNPEIGTEDEYDAMISQLDFHGMGQILDIVPNHMCISSAENLWWMDVLENGPSSVFVRTFDIDWQPVKKELQEKVLLPILGDQYGTVLERGELRLSLEEGTFFVNYYDTKVPVRPKTYSTILNHRIEELKEMLDQDHPHHAELLSIITAAGHLPDYTLTDKDLIAERAREKEVIKRRLRELYSESKEIERFIDENVRLFNGIQGVPQSFDLLDNLLNDQTYRLAHWRVATEEINYRRFFDVNSFCAVRVEYPEVFDQTHGLILKLVKEGKITGLRVDHPDGLYDPLEYFRRLQYNCFVQTRLQYAEGVTEGIPLPYHESYTESEIDRRYTETMADPLRDKPFYIVGEKILIKSERMPEDWPIFSTTGYVFLNSLNGIFIQARNEKIFETIYARYTKNRTPYQTILYEKKRLFMEVAMSGEINTLGRYLSRLAERNRHTRDFTRGSLINALEEIIALFPVYRSYTDASGVKERDRQHIEATVSKAKRKNTAVSGSVFDFVRDVLLLKFPSGFNEEEKNLWLDFTMKFQQVTGPIMAKGAEDTAFYVYNRLVSLNEVGGNPEKFGTSLDTFHGQNLERIKFWPHALITTSTHDCKRSEDVRARVNVLSEMPDQWRSALIRWGKKNKGKKIIVDGRRVPDQNEEYLLYQTLLGTWPVNFPDEGALKEYLSRIKEYMIKASREAKVNTSWVSHDNLYEDALVLFIEAIMNKKTNNEFLNDFFAFQKRISLYGMYNSLSQTLIKITSPGVPDFYQGTEIWNYSLVDPDNRRPVDFGHLQTMLDDMNLLETKIGPKALARHLTEKKTDGRIKLYITRKALGFRRQRDILFREGRYVPLFALGAMENNICAFARQYGDTTTITVAPRFYSELIEDPQTPPFGDAIWGDAILPYPSGAKGQRYRNVFTDEILETTEHWSMTGFFLRNIFANFPVALLESVSTEEEGTN